MTSLVRVVVALVTIGAASANPKNRAEVAHLRKPDRLPPAAVALLETRMAGHGDDLEWLLANVLMLNRENVEVSASGLAKAPKLARPTGTESDLLNASLPTRFFDLQDDLQAAAKNLAIAAHGHDDRAMAKAFGRLTETCVACHSVYLDDTLGPSEGAHQ